MPLLEPRGILRREWQMEPRVLIQESNSFPFTRSLLWPGWADH